MCRFDSSFDFVTVFCVFDVQTKNIIVASLVIGETNRIIKLEDASACSPVILAPDLACSPLTEKIFVSCFPLSEYVSWVYFYRLQTTSNADPKPPPNPQNIFTSPDFWIKAKTDRNSEIMRRAVFCLSFSRIFITLPTASSTCPQVVRHMPQEGIISLVEKR